MSRKNRRKPFSEETEELMQEELAAEEAEGEAEEEAAEEAPAEETKEETPAEETKEEANAKDPRDEKIAELTDRYQRLLAEFDNYRKRTEKEKLAQYDMGVSKAVEKILPAVDSFERGLATTKESDPESPVVAGMELIYKQLKKAMDEIGVEAMDAEGKVFDPNFHNAVIQVENEDLESGTVAAELIKGYTYKGRVIRPATVSVVQ
ncbi:MAG: nucleotide exchange factor GrpE [Lachnospiraceae bacterium]|nr:nucleotide exchange factor GrpE [Lachnospiraceae bacterium]